MSTAAIAAATISTIGMNNVDMVSFSFMAFLALIILDFAFLLGILIILWKIKGKLEGGLLNETTN